jgi:hypothetical protein
VTTAAPPRSAGAVALTLDPVALGEFLAERWEREPLLVQRDQPGRFDGVLSTAEAERIACGTGVRVPAFRLVRDGAQVPLATYTKDVPWRPGSFSGMADVPRVAAEFEAGATLVLQGLHLHHHPSAVYCRELEMALGCPVQANAYWTPSSAQGFDVHHDTHDVFVLQVAGRKRWRVYAPVLELPLKTQRWSPALGDPGEPVQELLLEPGDTLYLPRGWPHEAATGDGESLHLTIGLHPPTRLDALHAALDAAAGDVELRRAAAADGALPDGLLDRLAAQLDPEAVASRLRRRFVDGRRPILDDQLDQVRRLAALTADTPLERRDTVIADLDGTTLRFEGRTVAFPPQAAEALAAIAAADGPFTAASLPGRLDGAGRLVLVRRLIREGLLRTPGAAP